jgi:hypothetical protein
MPNRMAVLHVYNLAKHDRTLCVPKTAFVLI